MRSATENGSVLADIAHEAGKALAAKGPIDISQYGILMRNITLAIGIKAIFSGLTFFAQTTMRMAVFADMGTSLLVVANGLGMLHK